MEGMKIKEEDKYHAKRLKYMNNMRIMGAYTYKGGLAIEAWRSNLRPGKPLSTLGWRGQKKRHRQTLTTITLAGEV